MRCACPRCLGSGAGCPAEHERLDRLRVAAPAMLFGRGHRLALALSAVVLALAATGASAQGSRTIRFVVPYTPASGPDIVARLMAEEVGRARSVSIVVENRPGGGTTIGTEAVARAAPDGSTVLLVANSFVVNAALGKGNYDVSAS